MATKRIDPLKAKEAKQKKIAIGGFILLLALLAFQGPKTWKRLQGPQPVASATSTPTATTPAPAVPLPGADPTAVPVAAAAPELSAVADSDAAPAVEQGQLATFERFASKDPFAQQAEPVEVAPPPAAKPKDGSEEKPASGGAAAEGETSSGEEGSTDGGFTTDGGSTAAAREIATATSLAVNGVAEDVAVAATFPKDEPTFVLVSVAADRKSVQLGIAGGEYASGGETMKLGLGKKIMLQNTADGSRYEIELLTIAGVAVPKTTK